MFDSSSIKHNLTSSIINSVCRLQNDVRLKNLRKLRTIKKILKLGAHRA